MNTDTRTELEKILIEEFGYKLAICTNVQKCPKCRFRKENIDNKIKILLTLIEKTNKAAEERGKREVKKMVNEYLQKFVERIGNVGIGLPEYEALSELSEKKEEDNEKMEKE